MTRTQQMIKSAAQALQTSDMAFIKLDGFLLVARRSDGNCRPGKFIKRWYNAEGNKLSEAAVN
jgi:hypothetical protein